VRGPRGGGRDAEILGVRGVARAEQRGDIHRAAGRNPARDEVVGEGRRGPVSALITKIIVANWALGCDEKRLPLPQKRKFWDM
jgi:hypothetical protein